MVSITDSGSVALTVGTTPDTVYTGTTAGTYQVTLDLNTLVDDEEVVVTIQRKVLTGGTLRDAYVERIRGTCALPIFVSVPIASGFGLTVKANQRNGTTRTIDYEILKLD